MAKDDPRLTDGTRGRRTSGRVTMSEVARRAGVGAITVSRFLRDPATVSRRLRDRIAGAIRDLGYVPNLLAGSLASAGTPVIPVVVPSQANAVFADVIQGAADVILSRGHQMLMGTTGFSLEQEEALVSTFLGWSPLGIILTGADHTPRTRQLLEAAGLPVVEAFELSPAPMDMNVGFSHELAGRAMTRRLIDLGHRRVAFAGTLMDQDLRAGKRLQGYRKAMAEAGLETSVLAMDERTGFELGARVLDWVAAGAGVEAVFCANDLIAVGTVLECQRRGVAVPGQLAVAGFNGLPVSAAINPPLTTIRTPRYHIGRLAAEMILARAAGHPVEEPVVDVGFLIVEGGTTARWDKPVPAGAATQIT